MTVSRRPLPPSATATSSGAAEPSIAASPPATPDSSNVANLRRVREATGTLTTSALGRLEADLPWYRALSVEDRSYVGLVAQAGIAAFARWYEDPTKPPSAVGEMFAAAPPELTRSISLQHTLQIVRTVVEVVESQTDAIAVPGSERDLLEAVLRYSREVAFSAAEVYARAAEVRGAWDARLEALVVDAIVRGDADSSIWSRVSALGWTGNGRALVMVGTADETIDELSAGELRRAARRTAQDALVSIQGERIIVVLGGEGLVSAAQSMLPRLGKASVVIGPEVDHLGQAWRSASAALAGIRALPAWPGAPRPTLADDLLPERVLTGDPAARSTLYRDAFEPLREAGGSVLETLSAYLETGRSLEGAARELYVHPNTVRYRLRKVPEITGWDPLDARESFVLHIALSVGRLDREQSTIVGSRQTRG